MSNNFVKCELKAAKGILTLRNQARDLLWKSEECIAETETASIAFLVLTCSVSKILSKLPLKDIDKFINAIALSLKFK